VARAGLLASNLAAVVLLWLYGVSLADERCGGPHGGAGPALLGLGVGGLIEAAILLRPPFPAQRAVAPLVGLLAGALALRLGFTSEPNRCE
jgi:hypothetical protein